MKVMTVIARELSLRLSNSGRPCITIPRKAFLEWVETLLPDHLSVMAHRSFAINFEDHVSEALRGFGIAFALGKEAVIIANDADFAPTTTEVPTGSKPELKRYSRVSGKQPVEPHSDHEMVALAQKVGVPLAVLNVLKSMDVSEGPRALIRNHDGKWHVARSTHTSKANSAQTFISFLLDDVDGATTIEEAVQHAR